MLLLSHHLPGSGIRAEVLHPGQEIPFPTIVLILKFEAAKANPFLTTSKPIVIQTMRNDFCLQQKSQTHSPRLWDQGVGPAS